MKAISKLNLFLRVVASRNDGYHEIETLFYPLSKPADDVRLFRRKTSSGVIDSKAEITLHTDSPGLPVDAHNLCIQALSRLLENTGLSGDSFRIELKKSIPVSAGLGGGSSDAAAILRLMKKKYPGVLTDPLLKKIAIQIGADVPFFLHATPAAATGIGEKLRHVAGLPARLPILLVSPDFPVSAAWAYRNLIPGSVAGSDSGLADLISALRERNYTAAAHYLRNDLQKAVFEKFPLCGMLEDALMKTGALRVLMSGSGPALFALYPDFPERDNAAQTWKDIQLPVRLIPTE